MKGPPPRRALEVLAPLALALAALTGGCGLLVPRIHALGASEFNLGRLLWGAVATVPIAGLLPVLAASRRRSPAQRALLGVLLAWPLSVLGNAALGQDALGAWLNWRVRAIDFAALPARCHLNGSIGIENHEHVSFAPEEGIHYVFGPGLEVPPPLRGRVGRARW